MFEGVCEATVAGVQAADPFTLAAALARVTQDELSAVSADEAECVVAATQRVMNAMSARQNVAVTAYTEHVLATRDTERAARHASGAPLPVGQPTPTQEAAAGLAPVLRIAPRTMVTRIHTAATLGELPRTAALGWAGDVEPYRAAVIARAARQVGHEQLTEFEARLHHADITDLPGSRVKTRADLIAARLAPDPDESDQNAQGRPACEADREVRVGPADQAGLTKWDARLPTDSSLSMSAAVDALAAQYRAGNPELTVAQSRADALTNLVLSDVQVTTTATLTVPTSHAPTADPADHADHDDTAGHADSDLTTAPGDAGEPGADTVCGGEPMSEPAAPSEPGSEQAGNGAATAGASTTQTPAEASDQPSGPVTARLTPQPGCSCASRSPSWIDLVGPLSVPVVGPWAQDWPDPPLQDRYSRIVAHASEVDANPHLARDWDGRVWFVPKPVVVPPVGLLLPAQVTAILADPDTIIRLGAAQERTGAVDLLDERTYRPGAALARLVRARDGTCRHPGCATPAERCDLDHVIAYPHGPTTAANLQCLCRTHHGFKHHGGWTVTMTPDGVCTWTAPNGRSHTTHPHALHDDAA